MENLVGKNIMVTGGEGFLGRHLVRRLEELGNEVIVPTYRHNDIKDYSRVFKLITKFEIGYIFHLAAQAIVGTAYHNPLETLATNIMGTVNVLEAARHYPKIKGILVASSDKAYGKCRDKYTEDNPLAGDHPYDVSKSCADLIAQTYYKTYQLPVVITRAANTYGPGDIHLNRLIPGILKAIIKNEVLEIRSDGTFTRDYIYVEDVVDADIALMENIQKTKGEAFNISSNDHYVVLELVKKIGDILGKKVRYKVLSTAKNEIPSQSLSCEKIEKTISWKPKYSLEKAIPETFNWYQNNLRG